MKLISTIIVIILAQCVHLQPTFDIFNKISNSVSKSVSDFISDSCVFGVKSISVIVHKREIPNGKVISLNETSEVVDPNTDPNIVFLVHGFNSDANRSIFLELVSKLVERNFTVFLVDWSDAACTNGIPLIKFTEYPWAVNNTREVGEHLAKFAIVLKEECKYDLKNIKCIGHSLGAQVCGFTGKDIKKLSNSSISNIIGLDPAAPLFSWNNCKDRLCIEDADQVTTFKTSTLGFSKSLSLKSEPVGHSNFQFVNGQIQPGCNLLNPACSHTKAIEYLINILKDTLENKNAFPSIPLSFLPVCPNRNTTDCTFVDDKVLTGDIDVGNYYVCVNNKPPYYVKENSFSCQQ